MSSRRHGISAGIAAGIAQARPVEIATAGDDIANRIINGEAAR